MPPLRRRHSTSRLRATIIAVYTFNKHVIRHQFCKTCGCAPFAEGTGPDGKAMVVLNLRCADVDLLTISITRFDGASL